MLTTLIYIDYWHRSLVFSFVDPNKIFQNSFKFLSVCSFFVNKCIEEKSIQGLNLGCVCSTQSSSFFLSCNVNFI